MYKNEITYVKHAGKSLRGKAGIGCTTTQQGNGSTQMNHTHGNATHSIRADGGCMTEGTDGYAGTRTGGSGNHNTERGIFANL